MTKRDLLDFLQPFGDDIRIVTEGEGDDFGLIFDVDNPRYAIGKGGVFITVENIPQAFSNADDANVETGEGIVIL